MNKYYKKQLIILLAVSTIAFTISCIALITTKSATWYNFLIVFVGLAVFTTLIIIMTIREDKRDRTRLDEVRNDLTPYGFIIIYDDVSGNFDVKHDNREDVIRYQLDSSELEIFRDGIIAGIAWNYTEDETIEDTEQKEMEVD